VPFARIATLAAVSLTLGLAACGHDPEPKTVAAPAAAAADVPLEAASNAPAATATAAPKAKAPEARAPRKTAAPADVPGGTVGLDRFVDAVRQKLPDVALDRRDEEVEDLGEQACDALHTGRSATAAAGAVAAQGVAPGEARALVGLARDNLCRA